MKVTYIKSAMVVIEHKGKKVLCDPWLTEGIYYGSWYSFPLPKHTAKDFQDIDYIYISHVHPDHCDVETLKDLPKDKPVLILDFDEKFLLRTLQKVGFTNIIEVPHGKTVNLEEDFKIEILSGDNNDLRRFSIIYGCSEPRGKKTKQIDSLAIFSSDKQVIVNSNDVPVNLISGAFKYILDKYKKIDVLLVSYAGAGPYPQAYTMEKEAMLRSAIGASYSFLGGTFQYIHGLNPRYFIPYAGEYILGGKNWWMNRFKGTSEIEELEVDLLPILKDNKIDSKMVLLNRGENFDLDTEQASKPYTPTDFLARQRHIAMNLSNKIFDYEVSPVEPYDLMPYLVEARETMWNKQKEYLYYGNVDLLIDVGMECLYKINFKDKEITRFYRNQRIKENQPYIHAQIRFSLMDWILNRKANWNNAEVGSHILLSECYYNQVNKDMRSYEPMPHFLMSYFQRPLSSLKPLKQMAPEAIGVS